MHIAEVGRLWESLALLNLVIVQRLLEFAIDDKDD